jgi:hypothetical protein
MIYRTMAAMFRARSEAADEKRAFSRYHETAGTASTRTGIDTQWSALARDPHNRGQTRLDARQRCRHHGVARPP